MIKKLIIVLFITFFVISCKSAAPAAGSKAPEENAPSGVAEALEKLEENEELVIVSEGGEETSEIDETKENIAEIDELLDIEEGGKLTAEIDEQEQLDDTREQIAELSERIDVLTDLVMELLEQSLVRETPSVDPAPAPVQTQPPSSAQTPPAPVQRPPVQVTQPVQVTPPVIPAEEIPAAEEIAGEESAADQEEPAPFRSEYRPEVPPSPAARIESLTQMGAVPQDSEINFSRIVRATAGQQLEIPFRGNGWVYLGEIASRRGIVYNSRRNDPEGLSFIFTLEEAGIYTLKFFRQDFIRDYILNDHVQIIVGEAPAASTGWFGPYFDRGRVIAQPRWPSAAEEARIRSGLRPETQPVSTITAEPRITETKIEPQVTAPQVTASQSAAQQVASPQVTAPQVVAPQVAAPQSVSPQVASPQITAPQSAAQQSEAPQAEEPQSATLPETRARIPGTEGLSGDAIIQRAQSAFDGGNTASAIALLDQYMFDYPGGNDEVYWMYGQFYEANTPARNILLSIEYYRRLMNEYPQSRRFSDARRRAAYLERFYINIQ